MSSSARLLLRELGRRQFQLLTVESCTGGLLASRLTDVPGSSAVFWGGLVTYHNDAKVTVAGIAARTVVRYGAVSAETARALATSGLGKLRRATRGRIGPRGWIALATTGIAGPGGGSARKPVGVCFLAVALAEGRGKARFFVREIRAPRGAARASNKRYFAEAALKLAGEVLSP